MPALRTRPSGSPCPNAVRTVVLADDSVLVRGLFARWLADAGGFHVVGVAGDAESAIDQAARHRPDILVLDLGLENRAGTDPLPEIVRRSPRTSVLVATTLDTAHAGRALQAITLGAQDVIAKPDSRADLTQSPDFREEFLLRLRGAIDESREAPAGQPAPRLPPARQAMPMTATPPRYLLVGASTGGPRAIARVLADLGPALDDLTTLVVQHMPPLFTASFAEQTAAATGRPAREPADGERLVPGTIYVAPGGRHLGIDRRLGHIVASIDDGPPVSYCRPAVDVLFRAAARHLGPAALGLVLTGMGSDGTEGAGALRAAGAAVIVQDEASSTIWGMPGSVVRARHASTILPLAEIGPAVRLMLHRGGAA